MSMETDGDAVFTRDQMPRHLQVNAATQLSEGSQSVRDWLREFYGRYSTQKAVTVIISLNVLLVVIQTTRLTANCCVGNEKSQAIINQIDLCFLIFYTLELGLNFYAHYFWEFWKCTWNSFDFLVILGSWIPGQNVAAVRMLRMLRLVRITGRTESLAFILETLYQSMNGIVGLLWLLMGVVTMYALLGVGLFKEKSDKFRDFLTACWTLFITLTGESWPHIAEPLVEQYWYAPIYFSTFVITGSVVIINVILAVFIDTAKLVTLRRMDMCDEVQKMKPQNDIVANLKVNTMQPTSVVNGSMSASRLYFNRTDVQHCVYILFDWEDLNLISRAECRVGVDMILTFKGYSVLVEPILDGNLQYARTILSAAWQKKDVQM